MVLYSLTSVVYGPPAPSPIRPAVVFIIANIEHFHRDPHGTIITERLPPSKLPMDMRANGRRPLVRASTRHTEEPVALIGFLAHRGTKSSCRNCVIFLRLNLVKDNRSPTRGPDVGIFSTLVDKSTIARSRRRRCLTAVRDL